MPSGKRLISSERQAFISERELRPCVWPPGSQRMRKSTVAFSGLIVHRNRAYLG
jgi:hypothetical protein